MMTTESIAHSFHSFRLGDIVKSKALLGVRLQICVETGHPNDFGIFYGPETAGHDCPGAYSKEGPEGYRKWRGAWHQRLTCPDNLIDCVHVAEVLPGGRLGRQGWLFTDHIVKIPFLLLLPNEGGGRASKIKADVKARRQNIASLKACLNHDIRVREAQYEEIGAEVLRLKQRLQELEADHRQAEEDIWKMHHERGHVIREEQEAVDHIVFTHHDIDFSSL